MCRPAQDPLCWAFPTAIRVHHCFISYHAPCTHTVNNSEDRECAFIKSLSKLTPAFHNGQMKKRRKKSLAFQSSDSASSLCPSKTREQRKLSGIEFTKGNIWKAAHPVVGKPEGSTVKSKKRRCSSACCKACAWRPQILS